MLLSAAVFGRHPVVELVRRQAQQHDGDEHDQQDDSRTTVPGITRMQVHGLTA
jgi:hypothetical protein